MKIPDKYRLYLLPAILILIGAAFRFYGCWCAQFSNDMDSGVCYLMSKHIAEGTDFPIFFYGQSYMGSLEPATAALFCKLLGMTDLAPCLGTGFYALLLLPVIYLWAHDIAGRTAGTAALIFCLVGPSYYFLFMANPRGGYAVILLVTALILWLSGRMVVAEQKNTKPIWKLWLLLGFMAGIGWWTHELTAFSMLTAAGLFLICIPKKCFSWRIPVGLTGFFAGSAPFWMWNFSNDWKSFEMAHTITPSGFNVALLLFLGERFPKLLGSGFLPDWAWTGQLVIIILTTMVTAAILVRHRNSRPEQTPYLLGIMLFINISVVLSCLSKFALLNTGRYILPLVPAMAVMTGVVIAISSKTTWRVLGWAGLAVLVICQAPILKKVHDAFETDKIKNGHIHKIGDFLATKNIDICLTDFQHYSWNYRLREKVKLTVADMDRFCNYNQIREMADRVAVIACSTNIQSMLSIAGGNCSLDYIDEHDIRTDFTPPLKGWREMSPEYVSSAVDHENHEIKQIIDYRADSVWDYSGGSGIRPEITLTLTNRQQICGIRLYWDDNLPPDYWRIHGRIGDRWFPLTAESKTSGFFWSGIRPFFKGQYYRTEAAFKTVELDAVKISFVRTTHDWRLSELQLFSPSGKTDTLEKETLPELLALLKAKGIHRAYADRWVRNKIHDTFKGTVLVSQMPADHIKTTANMEEKVCLSKDTALIVCNDSAERSRHILESAGVTMEETVLPNWTVFTFGSGWESEYEEIDYLLWSGTSVHFYNVKAWSHSLYNKASGLSASNAIPLLEKAVALYPNHRDAILRLAECYLQADPGSSRSAELTGLAHSMWTPATRCPILFKNGVIFAGITIDKTELKPGENLNIKYFWLAPTNVNSKDLSVFVHFQNDKQTFQDDHVFLAGADTSIQPFTEVFVENRTVKVPADAKPGEWTVKIGILNRAYGINDRIKAYTDMPKRRNRVTLPVSLKIN